MVRGGFPVLTIQQVSKPAMKALLITSKDLSDTLNLIILSF